MLIANATTAQGEHVVGVSGGRVHGRDMYSNPYAWSWLRCPTTHSFRKVDTTHDVLQSQKTDTRTEAAGTQYFSSAEEELPAAGERPAALAETQGPEKVEWHIADVMEFFPFVPIFDGPVSFPGGALLDLLKGIIVEFVIEQIIDVPKISLLSVVRQDPCNERRRRRKIW